VPARIIWLLFLSVLALVGACDGGEGAEPTLTATVPQDIASFRAFVAEHIAPAIAEGDGEALLADAFSQRLTCGGGPGYSFHPCQGLPEGTVLEGIYLTEWATEDMRIVPVPEVAEDFAELVRGAPADAGDQFGDAEPTLYGLAAEGVGQEGGYLYEAIVTVMQPEMEDLVRVVRAYQFAVDTDFPRGWVLTGMVKTDTLAADWLSGRCTDCYDYWEPWPGGSP